MAFVLYRESYMYHKRGWTENHKIIPYDAWKDKVACNVYFFKGLVDVCLSFCIYFYTIDTLIHHYFLNIRWGPFPYLHSCRLSGETSTGCRDEFRTRACLTASQRATNRATLHPSIFTIWKSVKFINPFLFLTLILCAPWVLPCKSPSHHKIASNKEASKAPFSIGREFKLFCGSFQ